MALAGSFLPMPIMAAVHRSSIPPRTLAFFNTHTAEALRVCYFKNGEYVPAALKKIDYVLRDHRTNEIMPIDSRLLDTLYQVQCRLGTSDPFHVISGYRSPKTNEMLRRISSGVAQASLHLKGRAIDIRLPQFSTRKLRQVCLGLRAGGVGYYPKSDFVHVDTGQVRSW